MDRAAARQGVQGVEQQVYDDLVDLLGIQQECHRLGGEVGGKRYLLPPGGCFHQRQRPAKDRDEVGLAALRARRAREVNEELDALLHAADLMFDDAQVFRRQAGSLAALQAGLHEHFHRRQRVSQLMRHPRRNLPDRRQLFRPQYFALPLLELIDDAFNLSDDSLQLAVQVWKIALLFQGDGAQLAIEPAGGIANTDAELVNRMVQAARHGVAKQQTAQRSAQAKGEQTPVKALNDP